MKWFRRKDSVRYGFAVFLINADDTDGECLSATYPKYRTYEEAHARCVESMGEFIKSPSTDVSRLRGGIFDRSGECCAELTPRLLASFN